MAKFYASLLITFPVLIQSFINHIFQYSEYRKSLLKTITYSRNNDPTTQTDEEVRAILRDIREDNSKISVESLREFAQLDAELMRSLKTRRSFLSLIVEQFVQTFDDFQLSSKTKKFDKEKSESLSNNMKFIAAKREKIVVLGTGWGAYSFLKTIG